MTTPEQIAVERVVAGGEGLGRLADGRTVFVPGGLPGDVVSIDALDDKGRWGRATAWTLTTPSDERVQPACPIADRCGGCDWMAWALQAQRAGKAQIVVDALRRTGGVKVDAPQVLGGEDLGYRARIRLAAAGGVLGFRQRRSHGVVAVEQCPVADPALNEALNVLGTLEPPPVGILEVELRADELGVMARVLLDRVDKPERTWVYMLGQRMPTVADQRKGRRVVRLHGRWIPPEPDRQSWPVTDEIRLHASSRAFTQVNPLGNRLLVQTVLDAVPEGAETFVDAYCGAGNFSLPLLARGLRGIGMDGSKDAIEDATWASAEQGLQGRFVAGDIAKGLVQAVKAAAISQPDVLVVDPPRAGAKKALPALVAVEPKRIIYVACDPVSLARDVQALQARSWRLTGLTCVDLFPQTHHVETVATLDRE